MCRAKTQLDPGVIDALDAALQTNGADWAPTLEAITVPLLIFAADPSLGAIVGPETIARVRGIKPGAEIALIPGVGHLIRFDAFEAFMRALRPFLAG
jgi:pimeloyl-ACP methyl ester carboxylesterase